MLTFSSCPSPLSDLISQLGAFGDRLMQVSESRAKSKASRIFVLRQRLLYVYAGEAGAGAATAEYGKVQLCIGAARGGKSFSGQLSWLVLKKQFSTVDLHCFGGSGYWTGIRMAGDGMAKAILAILCSIVYFHHWWS